jgi:RecA-family ATPase
MSEEQTFEECVQWDAFNDPPIGEEEVGRVVANAAKLHTRNHGTAAPNTMQTADLEIIRGDELLSRPAPPRRWLVEIWMPMAETTMFGGDGGTGKTTLGLQLSLACISTGDWLGLKVAKCNVLYASAEDPADEIHYRLEQMRRHTQVAEADLARFILVDLAGKDATLATFDSKNGLIRPTPLFSKVESAAREHATGCVIFDAIADFYGGNESERREVRAFIGLLRGLAMRLNAAVVIIAHPSVDAIKTGRGYSGSTHWNNAVRSRLYFTEAAAEEGAAPNPDLKVIELAKANRAARGQKIHVMWTDGRFIATSPGSVENLTNATEAEAVFLHLLAKLDKQGRRVSPNPSSTYAPKVLAKEPGNRGIGKAALERAMPRLLDARKIHIRSYGPPSKERRCLALGPPPPAPGGSG